MKTPCGRTRIIAATAVAAMLMSHGVAAQVGRRRLPRRSRSSTAWPRASRRRTSRSIFRACRRTSGRRWPSWSRRPRMDALFLRQVWAGNETMLLDLRRRPAPLGQARLHYFLLNKGPWSRLDQNEPFIPGAPAKPPQAQLLSGGRHQGARSRSGSRRFERAERDQRHRLLHHHPPRRRTARFMRCRTASSTRASWRRSRRCCARPRR